MEHFCRGRLRFRVIDTGEPRHGCIVLLHGFPENADAWISTFPVLNDAGFRTVAPDQRGYSPEARPNGRRAYVLPELVDDTLALIDALGQRSVHVAGFDWGGMVGWALAARAPERVRSLTVAGTPHPGVFRDTLLASKQFLYSWHVPFFQLPILPERLMLGDGGRLLRRFLVWSGLDEPTAARYAERFTKEPAMATGALNWYRAVPPSFAYSRRIGAIGVPTAYVVGARDVFFPEQAILRTERWVSGAYRLRLIEGASHWLPEQHPRHLAESILALARET